MVDTRRIKSLMVARGYTQRSLAQKIGKNKNTLNAKLNGNGNFDTEEIIGICDALGIVDPVDKCAIFLLKTSQ